MVAAACLAGLLLAAPAGAQVCGDVTGDDEISVSDAQRVLKASVGQQVDLVCTDGCAELEPRIAALEALLANVTIVGDNLVLTGMNFQVVSGSGDTDGTVNGTGNVIIGYNEDANTDDREGSHNLVIGMNHAYSSYGGIVAGENNGITAAGASVLGGTGNASTGANAVIVSGTGNASTGDAAVIVGGTNNDSTGDGAVVVGGSGNEATGEVGAVLGGTDNSSTGDGAVIVGGEDNESDNDTTVVVGGESNRANGRSCVVVSGAQNLCTGRSSSISGGSLNLCSSSGSVIGGGSARTLGGASPNGWLAASLGPLY